MDTNNRKPTDPAIIAEAAALKEIYERENDLSQAAFGDAYGIGSQGMVWQYLNAERALNLEAALKFARGLKCSIADFSPRLAAKIDSATTSDTISEPVNRYQTGRIPVISYIQAGQWKEIVDPYAPGAGFDYIVTDQDISNHAFALEIEGLSMLPEFEPGHRVIIDPDVAPSPGDYVAARNGQNEGTFKKYRPRGINEHGETVFELVPLNEDYETLRSDREPIVIIGTMVEHRKYRKKGNK